MGSRRKTDVEGARLPELSRRAIVAGVPVAALAAPTSLAAMGIAPAAALAAPDDGSRRCASWLAIDAKIRRLQTRWAKLETWLAKEHDWFALSPAEQQALPSAQELRDIDGCLDVLFDKREALLETLSTASSASFETAIARLAVVERLMWPEDHPEAHALIVGVRRDLIAMSARRGVI